MKKKIHEISPALFPWIDFSTDTPCLTFNQTMTSPFHIVSESLMPPFTVVRKIPAISKYRIPYAKAICWQGPDWWISLQWHDAKHSYIYCLEIQSREDITLQLKCLYADIHWLYLLQGKLILADRSNKHSIHAKEHGQYFARQDDMTLSMPPGRHLLVGFTVAHDWLSRYRTEGLHFLPSIAQRNTFVPVPTNAAMLAELLHLLTLPLAARLQQDSNIYRPIAQLIELEVQLRAAASISHPPQRSRQLADAVHHYVLTLVQQGMPIPPISEIADHFYVHPDYLSRCHRIHYGQSLKPFTREQLLLRAHEQLQQGGRVSDVASSLGFWDLSAFSKEFKRFFGMRPSEVSK